MYQHDTGREDTNQEDTDQEAQAELEPQDPMLSIHVHVSICAIIGTSNIPIAGKHIPCSWRAGECKNKFAFPDSVLFQPTQKSNGFPGRPELDKT